MRQREFGPLLTLSHLIRDSSSHNIRTANAYVSPPSQCSSQCKRNVYVEGVTARNGGEVVGINQNFGDTATLINVCTDAKEACWIYDGCAGGCSPKKVRPC